MFTVLVCGGRDYSDECKVSKTLLDLCDKKGLWDTGHQHWAESLAVGLRIVTGEAHGADTLAKEWARWWVPKHQYQGYPADWKTHGFRAGPLRNQEMLDNERVDLVIAFPGGSGTADMVRRARKAKIPVQEVK